MNEPGENGGEVASALECKREIFRKSGRPDVVGRTPGNSR
jgi:hypothetical protein